MGFKKISVGLGLLILFVMPMILALDTPIQVNANSGEEVTIRVLNTDGSSGTLEGGTFLDEITDEEGIIKVTFSSDIVNYIDISVMKRKNGILQKYSDGSSVREIDNNGEHIKTGWPVEIDITVDPPVLIKSGKPAGIVEESATNSSDTEDSSIINSSEDSSIVEDKNEVGIGTGTTGKSIGVGKSILTSKITYFIFGLFIIVFVGGFIVKKKIINSAHPKSKKSEFKVLSKEGPKPINAERPWEDPKLRDAEMKLGEAKKELDEIKNKEASLQEARKKIEADKTELRRLEGE